MGERRGTKALELWCRRMTDGYPGVKIENMTTSWRDGLAFCAIIHRFRPDLIDFSKLKKNDVYHNNELAFRIAERHLGIPALLEPEDMVEFPVPDRLSILTYLSQFFQVFAGTQGSSQNRIAPKRAQTSPDHSIVSPASTSPPSKVALFGTGKIHREPCAKCALPVFIAERLNVGKSLYHRTCFKCARCTAQLTLDNYYETENGEYCCETCPDEEKPPTLNSPTVLSSPQNLNEESVRFRSMSDEEKTASIRAKFEIDEYSAEFETALEYSNDKSSTLNSEQSKEFTMARTHFMQTQINNSNSSSSSIGGEDSGNEDEKLNKKFGDCENELNNEQNDSGFPNINNNKLDTSVNIQISDSCSVSENLDKTENNIDVTKDKSVMENDINNSSLVKERKNLFENKQKSLDDEYPKAEQMSIINSKNENINLDKSDSLASQHDTSIIVISDSTIEEIEKESDDVIVITDSSTSNDNIKCELSDKPIDNNISVDKIETSEIINEIASNTEAVDYPEELNPFDDDNDDDDDNGAEVIKKSPKDSMNPFDEDEDEEMNDVVNINLKPTPSPRLKKKLLPSSGNRLSTPLYVPRVSMSSEPPTPATRKKKALTAPKVSLNPFWSSGDEEENDKSMDKLPVPTPRLSRTSTTTTDTQSNVSSTVYGSNSSLSSSSTAPTGTLRKKKLAPKPPSIPLVKLRASESPESSKGSSPCPSIQQSPYLTPKHRKNRKAPPPPNVSTPFPNRQETFNELSINVSPIGTTETITKTTNEMHQQPDNNKIIEDEKIAKDETNRNRQSQEFNKNPMMENRRNSILNKSTHGKWKRRKGQAPSRPIPQKRTIKSLPMEEIRRELDIIEIQLQGLEKQGVQIEKLIREKCENQTDAENVVSTEDSLPSDAEELILQLFEVVNEKNELFRKQTELMYLKRQQRLEEEHADVEYQIRCLMLQPEANKTDFDKGREEALINRLVEIVEMRNEIIECLEMDRVREAEEDDCISNHLNMYTLKKSTPIPEIEKSHKEKKKHKKEKRFKFKSNPKTDADKDIDESETSINNSCSSSTKTEKKKKKHLKFFD